jgi:hypothetical protein
LTIGRYLPILEVCDENREPSSQLRKRSSEWP